MLSHRISTMDEIKVISRTGNAPDGLELRRAKARGHYAECSGEGDNEQINWAVERLGKTRMVISAESWERIFGRK